MNMQRVISKTPVRISLFGGGTDYPDYFLRNQGKVIGLTIDKYTYVSVGCVSRFFDYKIRVVYSKTDQVNNIEEIQHPSVRACLRYKGIFLPLDIHISADLPARTGLGSSSAFTVGFLNALYALQGVRVSKQRLAEEACYVEQTLIGEHVGSQDQFHAAFGGMNVLEFTSSGVAARPIILSAQKKQVLQEHLLMFYTGITRYATEIVQEQMDRTKRFCNDEYLGQMVRLVSEAEDILAEASPEELPGELGLLLREGWELKKLLSNKISNPLLDSYYERAMAAGAYGGKLCGAGGGGFFVFCVPKDRQDAVRAALQELMEVRFAFESEGSRIIYLHE